MNKYRIAIIAAEFNQPLIGVMIATAKATIAEARRRDAPRITVLARYELPLVTRKAIAPAPTSMRSWCSGTSGEARPSMARSWAT